MTHEDAPTAAPEFAHQAGTAVLKGLGDLGIHGADGGLPQGEHLPTPEELKAEILGILAENDDELFAESVAAFAQARTEQLAVDDPISYVSGMTQPAEGLLDEETTVLAVIEGSGFVMDDPTIYTEMFSTLREMYRLPSWREKAEGDQFRRFILQGVQFAQGRYFGVQQEGALAEREAMHSAGSMLEDDGPDDAYSISEFKGKAFCAERAAVSQNMLALLGFDTTLVIGGQTQDGAPGLHAWNIVKNSKGSSILYDPTQPQLVLNESGDVIDLHPMLAPGADVLMDGKPLETTRKTYTLGADGQVSVTGTVAVVYQPPLSHRGGFVYDA